MKRVIAEYPYNDYYLYVVFHKKEGRRYANLISINNGKNDRTTISYARYLMSVKEGRILSPDEQVDHIDNDKTNDSIENLQILSAKENREKESYIHGRAMVLLRCPNCGNIFEREKRETFLGKGRGNYTACCRSCSGKFAAKLTRNPIDENVIASIKNNIIDTYHVHIDK